jgi:hypothetical protein
MFSGVVDILIVWRERSMGSKKRYPVSVQALLIRQIQVEAGQVPCYATAQVDHCARANCCWRSDCYCDDAVDAPASRSTKDFHYTIG